MASPYSGLTEAELTAIKSYLLDVITGKRALSTTVPGLSSSFRVASIEEARKELVMVNTALKELDPTTYPVTRTVMKAV